MSEPVPANPPPAGGYRAAVVMVGLTLLLCSGALFFRTPLRSRWWAWQVAHASSPAQRAAALARLCNVGDDGRWGLSVLLDDPRAEIRQYGILALQAARSDWARRRLVLALQDPDPDVRELAALGLARRHDDRVIPQLRAMYTRGPDATAAAACLALRRLGTPRAKAALAALAGVPASPVARAALIDALESVGSARAVRALLALLDDARPCDVPLPGARLMHKIAPLLTARGLATAPVAVPASHPCRTVAERAAAALEHITNLHPPFASDLPETDRRAAARIWQSWAERSAASSRAP